MARKLLYHRDLDDSVGTYITDYIMAIITLPLIICLLVKLCRTKTKDMSIVTSLIGAPVTLMSCAVVTYAGSLVCMAVLAGVAHQILQEAENYITWHDDMKYLLFWKIGTAFISPALFCLLCMTDKIIDLETNIRVPLWFRKIYYALSILLSLAVLVYNFHHMLTSDDPFSLRNMFMVFFVGIGIYGFTTIFVLVYRLFVCRTPMNESIRKTKREQTTKDTPVNPSYMLKIAACKCNGFWSSTETGSGITKDLLLHVMSPWVFIIGGVTNFMLRSKCSDSHDAFRLKGCPLPNEFNHNAVFHVMYTIALVLVLLAEIYAIKRRNNEFRTVNKTSTALLIDQTHPQDGAIDSKSEFLV